jgi:hypothetical protein
VYNYVTPDYFYNTMRWWMKGWDSGCEFKGSDSAEAKKLGGPSAMQTPVIHLIDAILGVDHPSSNELQNAQKYMKPGHRDFIALVKDLNLREKMVGSDNAREAYNLCIENLHAFRRTHFGLAYNFVMVPSGMANSRGTGGTAITSFLKKLD